MRKKMIKPEIELFALEENDIITVSGQFSFTDPTGPFSEDAGNNEDYSGIHWNH